MSVIYEGTKLTGRVTRLEEKAVDEQMQKYCVTGLQRRVSAGVCVPAVLSHQSGINVVENVGPNFSDVYQITSASYHKVNSNKQTDPGPRTEAR
jgi:hypothetical protein